MYSVFLYYCYSDDKSVLSRKNLSIMRAVLFNTNRCSNFCGDHVGSGRGAVDIAMCEPPREIAPLDGYFHLSLTACPPRRRMAHHLSSAPPICPHSVPTKLFPTVPLSSFVKLLKLVVCMFAANYFSGVSNRNLFN